MRSRCIYTAVAASMAMGTALTRYIACNSTQLVVYAGRATVAAVRLAPGSAYVQ